MKMYYVSDNSFNVVHCKVIEIGECRSLVSTELPWGTVTAVVPSMDLYATEKEANNALKRKLVDSIADDRKAIEQLQEEIEYKERKLAILRGE